MGVVWISQRQVNVSPGSHSVAAYLQPVEATHPAESVPSGALDGSSERSYSSKDGVASGAKWVISEGEFQAIAAAVRSGDVTVRNKSLNHLQSLAEFSANLSKIREELVRMDSADEAFAPLVAALAAVGTAEIQNVLREVVEQRSGDWRCYSAVVPSLGLLTQPSASTVEFLVSQSRHPDPDISSTAALAVGSIVHTLSKTDPRKGEELLGSYLAKISSNDTTLDDLKESLAVVGNSGLSSAVPVILKHVNDPRADLRAEVVMALRFMRTTQVEDVLLLRLARETDLEVRLRIVDALIHGPVPERALSQIASALKQRGKTESVLREKLLELFFHVNLDSNAKRRWSEWLTRYVEDETDSAVRRKASAALQELLRAP